MRGGGGLYLVSLLEGLDKTRRVGEAEAGKAAGVLGADARLAYEAEVELLRGDVVVADGDEAELLGRRPAHLPPPGSQGTMRAAGRARTQGLHIKDPRAIPRRTVK